MRAKYIRRMHNDSGLHRLVEIVDDLEEVVERRQAVFAHEHVADLGMQLLPAQYPLPLPGVGVFSLCALWALGLQEQQDYRAVVHKICSPL